MSYSTFPNYLSKQPTEMTFEAVVELIRHDERVSFLTREFRATGDKSIKQASPLFAVAVRFQGGKSRDAIESLTGVSLVDIDHVGLHEEAPPLEALREKAISDPHTLLCYTTISGHGLRVLFRYDLDSTVPLEKQILYYAKAFAAGNDYYARLLGVDTDLQCKNVTRLSGLAHDPQVYVNPEAQPFTKEDIAIYSQTRVQKQKAERKKLRERKRLQAFYDATLRDEVEAEGALYAPGHHNDYVMRVGYKLNQYGFSEDVAVAWAVETFAEYEDTAGVIHACYGRTGEHGTRSVRSSHKPREAGDGGTGYASVTDIQDFLSGNIRLRHNIITRRVEYTSLEDSGWTSAEPITDRTVNSLWSRMSETQRVFPGDLYRVIESDYVPDYNPFVDFLEALPALEALQRDVMPVTKLAQSVTVTGGDDEQERFERYLRKWLVGMVAAWVNPTVVNNVILVLIGEQGAYKTTWFQYLLPPALRSYFYTKTNANRMQRDDMLTLAQYGLICCEELDTMRPSELNQLKAVVTMQAIDERAAYAHYKEQRPHIASFCGTGNNIQFLSDPTGNRRWLPFEIESIRSPREFPFDYEGIYAEAYTLYRQGFQHWFSRPEILELASHNSKFETPRLEVELIQEYFRVPMPGENGEFLSVAMAMQIISANISQKLSSVNLGRAFREMGFPMKRMKMTRGYVVVRYSASEMEARRKVAGSSESSPQVDG